MFRLFIAATFLVLLFAAGCGDDRADSLGAPCSRDAHCGERAFCLEGGDFPGGFCSVPCGHSSQCPDDTACIDKRNGACLFRCRDSSECPSGWRCQDEDLKGSPGRVSVCIGN
jgi:hypothetical protein